MSDGSDLLPWQMPVFETLRRAQENNRLPHGLLLNARTGSGSGTFVRLWAQRLLCREPGEFACGVCKSCQLFSAETHPDFHLLRVPEGKKQIPVDAIRHLIAQLTETSQLGGWRVAVIEQAETLSHSGFNALLKTLEEPGQQVMIILITSNPASIPATVISRCQQLSLEPQSDREVEQWVHLQLPEAELSDIQLAFELCFRAPLATLELVKSAELGNYRHVIQQLYGLLGEPSGYYAVADSVPLSALQLFDTWLLLVNQLVRSAMGLPFTLEEQMGVESERGSATELNLKRLLSFHSELLKQRQQLIAGIALNPSMQLDALLEQWVKCSKLP